MAHGTQACYKNGCRRPECTAAATRAVQKVRRQQRRARLALEERLAARLRSARYHREQWLEPPVGVNQIAWANEVERTIARLERGNSAVRKALEGAACL